jgi:hypothetical protein
MSHGSIRAKKDCEVKFVGLGLKKLFTIQNSPLRGELDCFLSSKDTVSCSAGDTCKMSSSSV